MKTHPKISIKTHQFWKTPKFVKNPQNLGFKTWNAWMWRDWKLTKWRNSWKCLKNPWGTKIGGRSKSLGENIEKYRERYRMKWISDRTGSLNSASSKSQQMQVSRGIKTPIEEGVKKWSSIAEVSRNNSSKSRIESSIHQVSRSNRGCRPTLERSTRYREVVGIAIKKCWRSLTNNKVSRRCRASF